MSTPALDFEVTTEEELVALYAESLPVFIVAFLDSRFTLPANAYQRHVLARPKVPWSERTHDDFTVDAAPRGAAKSTVVSWADLLHDAVFGHEAFIAVISTGYRLAESIVRDLFDVFTGDSYPDMHAELGPFRVQGASTDFVVRSPWGNRKGTRIAAFSLGGSVRGEKHAGTRITKCVLDDIDHPQRVRNPRLRDEGWEFIEKDVLKAGIHGGYLVRMVGTVLHPDSLLSRAMASPAWRASLWRSVLDWPERTDLWERCRRLWADLTDPERKDRARAFYEQHRLEMDAGGRVLWPEAENLFALHEMLWANRAAFLSEKQNEPRDPDRQVFVVDDLVRCRFDGVTIHAAGGREVPISECSLAVWLDPRASDELEKNDYAAIAFVARDRHGYRYVLKCSQKRDTPADARGRMWAWFERYPHAVFGYEDNGFAALNDEGFRREQKDRQAAGKVWKLEPKGHTSTANKQDRILGLQPDVENGWVQFAEDLDPLTLDQIEQFPTGQHDDGIDAIERAVWLVDRTGRKLKIR